MKMVKKIWIGNNKYRKEVCEGLWTRVQAQERSILDYNLTNSKLLSTVTEIIIDDNKQYSVFKLRKIRKTYSEHDAIILKLNFIRAIRKKRTT